jgi:hypothetical protein
MGSEPELALAAVADVDFREFSVKHRSTGNTGSLRLMDVPALRQTGGPFRAPFNAAAISSRLGPIEPSKNIQSK